MSKPKMSNEWLESYLEKHPDGYLSSPKVAAAFKEETGQNISHVAVYYRLEDRAPERLKTKMRRCKIPQEWVEKFTKDRKSRPITSTEFMDAAQIDLNISISPKDSIRLLDRTLGLDRPMSKCGPKKRLRMSI